MKKENILNLKLLILTSAMSIIAWNGGFNNSFGKGDVVFGAIFSIITLIVFFKE